MSNATQSTSLSPYGAAKVVNALLAEAGVEKVLPPQMFYTYVAKGYIPADENKKIAEADLLEWATKYLAKQGVKVDA